MAEHIPFPDLSSDKINSRLNPIVTSVWEIVDTPESRVEAVQVAGSAKALLDEIEKTEKHMRDPFNEGLRRISAFFSPFKQQCEKVIADQKRAIIAYDKQVAEKAEAERRAREAAMAQEKARMEAEAKARADEAARRDAEAREAAQRAEQLRVQAEIAASTGDSKAAEQATRASIEEERKSKEAAAARELAEAQASSSAASAVMATTPVSAGSVRQKGTTKRWKWELQDKLEVVKFIAANPAYLNVIEIDSKVMNGMATAMKGTFPVKGIRVYEEQSLTLRGAA